MNIATATAAAITMCMPVIAKLGKKLKMSPKSIEAQLFAPDGLSVNANDANVNPISLGFKVERTPKHGFVAKACDGWSLSMKTNKYGDDNVTTFRLVPADSVVRYKSRQGK